MIKINDNINIRGLYRKVVCDVKVKVFILKNFCLFIINYLNKFFFKKMIFLNNKRRFIMYC